MLDQLIVEGRATNARGDLLEIKPTKALPGKRRLSEVLSELRTDAR